MAPIELALVLTLIQLTLARQDRTIATQILGNSLQLQCTLSPPALQSWELTRFNTTNVIVARNATINNYDCVGSFLSTETTDRCRTGVGVNHTTGMTISLNALSMDDAGRYACIGNGSSSEEHDVTVVQNSSPQLILTINGTRLLETSASSHKLVVQAGSPLDFTCRIVYSGYHRPTLKMFVFLASGALTSSSENGTTTGSGDNSEYRINETVMLTVSYIVAEKDDSFNVTCQMDGDTFAISSTDVILKATKSTDSAPTLSDSAVVVIVATLCGAALCVFVIVFIVTCIRRQELQCWKKRKQGKPTHPSQIPEIIITDATVQPIPVMGPSSSRYIATPEADAADRVPTLEELIQPEYRVNEDGDEDNYEPSAHRTATKSSSKQQSDAFFDIGGGVSTVEAFTIDEPTNGESTDDSTSPRDEAPGEARTPVKTKKKIQVESLVS